MASKKHKDALVRALDNAKISIDALPCEMIASLMKDPSNAVTFSERSTYRRSRFEARNESPMMRKCEL